MKKFFNILKKIIKFAVIGIAIIILFSLVANKCETCRKSNKSTTSAAIAYAEATVQPRASGIKVIDFQGNLFTLPYYNYQGEGGGNVGTAWLLLYNLPLTEITIEILENVSNSLNYQLYIYNDKNDFTTIDIKDFHITIDLSTIINFNHLEIRMYSETVSNFNNNFYFYTGSYVPGYGQGLAAGLQQGKTEGAQLAQYGIFQNATFDAEFVYENDKIYVENLIPNYITNGIYFPRDRFGEYETYNHSDLYEANITINFAQPFAYSNDIPLVQPHDSDIMYFILTDTNGNKYYGDFYFKGMSADFPYVDGQGYIKDTIDMAPIVSMYIHCGRAVDTFFDLYLYQLDGNYYAGYTAGYNEGLSEGLRSGSSTGYKQGYDKGFAEGSEQGYANAINEGVSQIGLFNGALAFIKIFFQLTTQFLETKIAGDISLGLLIIGLPCAFMIVNLAIGLLKKWLGGRGASEGDDGS